MTKSEQLSAARGRLNSLNIPGTWSVIEEMPNGMAWQRGDLWITATADEEDDREVWYRIVMRHKDKMPTRQDVRLVKRKILGKSRPAYDVIPPDGRSVGSTRFCIVVVAPFDQEADLMPDFTVGEVY